MKSNYQARSGLFNISLEDDTPVVTEDTPVEQLEAPAGEIETEGLGEGWKDIIFTLVENGPMAPADIAEGDTGVTTLVSQDFVTKVVTSGEEFKYAATEKGVKLYCQVVGGDTLEDSIAKRKEWMKRDPEQAEEAAEQAEAKAEEEAKDAEETREEAYEIERIAENAEIATEAFNWFRRELKVEDIKGMSNNLAKAEKNVSKISDSGNVNLFHVDDRVAKYPFHGETVIKNLPQAMSEEARNIKTLTGILKNLIAASSSADKAKRYDPASDSNKLASMKFLGGIDVDVAKDPKAKAAGKSTRDNHESIFPNIAVVFLGVLLFSPVISMAVSAVSSYFAQEKIKRNAKMDKAAAKEYFTVKASDYTGSAKAIISASRECVSMLQQFQRNIEKLEESGDKSLKDFINYAKGVAFVSLDVIETNLLFMIRSGTKKA